ncbi:hypothetical protein [Ensifer aridi]|uniref:hypothetical protein n=1 Tax=Ensifer aridi TaxID=1708715 RepID=UPI0015E423CB|nr:hypothetical protein [Ensifer aridi]
MYASEKAAWLSRAAQATSAIAGLSIRLMRAKPNRRDRRPDLYSAIVREAYTII